MSIKITNEKFSLVKLCKLLENSDSTFVFCQNRSLLPKNPTCKIENNHGVLPIEKRGTSSYRVRCRKKHPKNKTFSSSLLTNNWFERHKISIQEILFLTYFFTQRLTYEQVQKEMIRVNNTTVSRETICDLFFYCREVIMKCLDVIHEEEGLFGRNDSEIQIDETKIGKENTIVVEWSTDLGFLE